MYALACNTVFQTILCTQVEVSQRAAVLLIAASNPGTELDDPLADDLSTQEDVATLWVLSARPQLVCYSQVHLGVVALAWTALVIFVIGCPLRTLYWAHARIVRVTNGWPENTVGCCDGSLQYASG
jgi:hypothetical protein